MTLAPRVVRPFSVVVVVLALGAFGGVGFLVGRSKRVPRSRAASSWASAAAAAYSRERTSAYQLAWRRAYGRGRLSGTASATRAGTRAGRSAGSAQATRGSAALEALAAALASAPIKLTRTTRTDVCVPVGGGLCEVLGPAVTGKPCPPGSVANPVGGVLCVPRVLLLVARVRDPPRPTVTAP